jgi:hypothetical protein
LYKIVFNHPILDINSGFECITRNKKNKIGLGCIKII